MLLHVALETEHELSPVALEQMPLPVESGTEQ
jgi:hypothetical protein